MDVTKILGIGIIGAFFAVTVRGYRPELGMSIALATGLAIFAVLIPQIGEMTEGLYEICSTGKIDIGYFRTIVKIIGIAYVTQFSAELARDAGEGAVARKIELGGKVSVITVMLPIVKNLTEIIINTLMSF